MKSFRIHTYADASQGILDSDAPVPDIKENQVLVNVRAASVNPFDISLSSGVMKDRLPLTLPYTIGGDFSGVVGLIGAKVTKLAVGDEVYGQAVVVNGGSGSFAEKVAANEANTAKKPTSVDFPAAASLPLVGSSAVQAIEEHIRIVKNQRILIHGGAGGIGSLAIQIAKFHGAFVATTASGDGLAFVKKLGADIVIDYKSQRFEDLIKDYDAVFDTVGGPVTNSSLGVLKAAGILVTMIGQPDEAKAASLGITAIRQATKSTAEHLIRLSELVDNGAVPPEIDKIFPLRDASSAFTYFIKGHPNGKVVVNVSG